MTGLGFYTGSHCSSGRILTFFLHIFALRGGFDSGFIPHFQNAFEPVRTRSRTRSTRSSPFQPVRERRKFYVFYRNPFETRSKPVRNPFETRSQPVRKVVFFTSFTRSAALRFLRSYCGVSGSLCQAYLSFLF